MSSTVLSIYFNFRSPYCYLASKSMFSLLDDFNVTLDWRPLGGWSGRSAPDRAKVKMPLARQDVSRWCRRLNIPFNPPKESEPTRAAAASTFAEENGRLREYVVAVMHEEWANGRNIGNGGLLREVARQAGLDPALLLGAADDPGRRQALADNWEAARGIGVIGVPSFVVGEQIFWGNDRIDFAAEHLQELGLAKPS